MPFAPHDIRPPHFNVLLLDDDAVEGELLAQSLRGARSSVVVHVVDNSEAAIAFLYKDGHFAECPTPDLVFVDYRMPSNGGRVLSAIKGDPDLLAIPVVALSRDATPEVIHEIYSRHANCCINKPIDASDLAEDVLSALRFWIDVAMLRRTDRVSTRARVPAPVGHR